MDAADTALARRLSERLVQMLGPRLKAVRVFGSRARGLHRPDSDLDVLVLLDERDQVSRRQILDLACDLSAEDDYRAPLAPTVLSESEFQMLVDRERLFAHEVLRDGLVLFP